MWRWIKRLWSDKGGCITQSTAPRTLSPVEPEDSSRNAAPADAPHTPLPQQLRDLDRHTVQDQTCSSDLTPAQWEAAVPSAKRYMYSDGKPVGIANTVTKYQEHRPLKPHLTPFEARVEAKMAEEEVVRAAVHGISSDSYASNTGAIKQQLAFDDAARGSSSSRV